MRPNTTAADMELLHRRRLGGTLTWEERARAAAFDPTDPHNRRYWTGFVHNDTWYPPHLIGLALAWLLFLIIPAGIVIALIVLLFSPFLP